MIESNSVRRALSRVREEMSPTRDDKARLRARILAPAALLAHQTGAHDAAAGDVAAPSAAAPGAAAGRGVAAPSLTRWAALKAAGSVGAAAGLALLGAGGGVGFWLGHEVASEHARDVAVIEAPAGASQLPSVERAASAQLASSAQAEQGAALKERSVPTPVAAEGPRASEPRRTEVQPRAHARRREDPNPLNDELALLRRVERALRNNDPALARALLRELDERFPDSRLGEERAAAWRIADCRSGEPGANESARAFLREHGASVYRKRIVLACALDGEPAAPGARAGAKGLEAAPMKNAESADTHVR
jgi:hypothetical protein